MGSEMCIRDRVYFSDAVASKDVQIVEQFPVHSHSSIEYHAALVGTKSSRNVQNLYYALVSDRFADILLTNGFVLPQK